MNYICISECILITFLWKAIHVARLNDSQIVISKYFTDKTMYFYYYLKTKMGLFYLKISLSIYLAPYYKNGLAHKYYSGDYLNSIS